MCLHYVLDDWFAQDVQPRWKGRAFLIRHADDFVSGFTREDDAQRLRDVRPQRFGTSGATLHPEGTRLAPVPTTAAAAGPRGSAAGPAAGDV